MTRRCHCPTLPAKPANVVSLPSFFVVKKEGRGKKRKRHTKKDLKNKYAPALVLSKKAPSIQLAGHATLLKMISSVAVLWRPHCVAGSKALHADCFYTAT